MVKQEVEQGQWNKENNIVHRAVDIVQPFWVNMVKKEDRLPMSVNVPEDR